MKPRHKPPQAPQATNDTPTASPSPHEPDEPPRREAANRSRNAADIRNGNQPTRCTPPDILTSCHPSESTTPTRCATHERHPPANRHRVGSDATNQRTPPHPCQMTAAPYTFIIYIRGRHAAPLTRATPPPRRIRRNQPANTHHEPPQTDTRNHAPRHLHTMSHTARDLDARKRSENEPKAGESLDIFVAISENVWLFQNFSLKLFGCFKTYSYLCSTKSNKQVTNP
jgi:hypothetical protein